MADRGLSHTRDVNPAAVLRLAWMDLLSAAGIVVAWLLRDRLEPETLSSVLLWPVLFEAMLWIALTIAGAGARVRMAASSKTPESIAA